MRLCSPEMGISPGSNLGGAVYDRELLKELARQGVHIEIPLPQGEAHEAVPGWRITRTPRHRVYTYEYNLLFLPALRKLWKEGRFDLLRIHTASIAPLGRLWKALTGAPTTLHLHHLEEKRLTRALLAATIHSYDLVTTLSEYSREQILRAYKLPPEKVAILPPGIAEQYQPRSPRQDLRGRYGLEGKITLLYMGALIERKNLRFLMDRFDQVRRQQPAMKLMIAGSGPLLAALTGYAKSLNLEDHVVFPGYVPEAEKVDFYNLADIFVFPSRLEGFGMAPAEAMACGVPVVCSDAASLPEVVGDAGLLASPLDPEEFSRCILRLSGDPAFRARLGEAGRQRIRQNFSWERTAQVAAGCYQGIISP